MMPPRPVHPKERKVYELSSNENFSLGRSAKVGIFFISPAFYFLAVS
jgi:hypothetical protein